MSNNKESLPPGVKFENTYKHYQNKGGYGIPNLNSTKATEQKKSKHVPTGFEEEDDESQEIELHAPKNTISQPKKSQTQPGSGFSFMKSKPAVEPPKKDE